MADVKWIKIVTDIFDDEKMCAIESLPDGLVMELVWFKILCLAGKCNNNGFLYVANKIAYTDEMLAKIFRMEIGVVQRALSTFQDLEMIEVVDNAYMISNWNYHQNGDSLEAMKESNRKRQQRFRDKQKQLKLEERNVTDNVINNVTSSISISNSLSNSSSFSYEEDIKEIIDYLNLKVGTNYTYKNKSFNKYITARLKEGHSFEDFKVVIDKKCTDWMGTEMEQYLKPTTLFAPSHFEEYLNQKIGKGKNNTTSKEDFLERWMNG